MTDPYRTIQIAPGRLYVAPLPQETPRGFRGLLGRFVDRWRAYRFKRSPRWVEIGYTTEWPPSSLIDFREEPRG